MKINVSTANRASRLVSSPCFVLTSSDFLYAGFTVNRDFSVTVDDSKTRASDEAKKLVHACRQQDNDKSAASPAEQLDRLAACMAEQMNATLTKQQEEIDFNRKVRKDMTDQYKLYACDDPDSNTTRSFHNGTWTYHRPQSIDMQRNRQERHLVKTLFESDANRLLYVEDFLTPEQCQAVLQQVSHGVLPLAARHESTTVDSVIQKMETFASEIFQANVQYKNKDPILGVTTVAASRADATHNQQSQVTRANPSDAASIRIVCQAPTLGGSLQFYKTGARVGTVGAVGSLVATIYKNLETGQRDDVDEFLSESMICPVQEGALTYLYDNYAF